MQRPNWYPEDRERGSGRNLPPIRAWSLTTQLIVAMVALYVLNLLVPALTGLLALQREHLVNPLRWYELFTYALVHDPSNPLHLLFNCLFLYWFGSQLEGWLGRRRYATLCALAAASGALGYVAIELFAGGVSASLIGASGVVSGIMVAFALLWPNQEVIFIVFQVRVWILVTILLALDAYFGARYLLGQGSTGTAHFAHLGGALAGWFFLRHGGRLRGIERFVARFRHRRAQARHQQRAVLRREVDRLLDKINRDGIASLSRSERRFLETASRDLRDRE